MENLELGEYNKNRKIWQIGIVVRNLEEAIEAWEKFYHVGPWETLTFSDKNINENVIHGASANQEGFYFRIAASMIGEMQIELIEANESVPLYMNFLEKCGGGIHHFKERVLDERMESQIAEYKHDGMPILFGGKFKNITFYYIDTMEKLGFQLEIGNCEKLKP